MMKKILCFIDLLGAGGAQRQLVGLATLLKERKYDVSVVFYHENQFYAEHLKKAGVPCVYLKKAERNATRLFQISKYIHEQKPDVVISFLDTPNICTCFAKIFNKKFKAIVSERSATLNTGFKERIRFNFFRWADVIVPNSYSQEKYIQKVFPFLSKKIITIPNFVDLKHFAPSSTHKRNTTPEVIVVASVRNIKNTLGLIDAVATLRAQGPCFHISWYGVNSFNDSYVVHCINNIKQLGLSDCIELKEKTTQIKEQYQKADFFCLPSFFEGTPNVICEAMACGLPVICSDVCDNARFVEDGVNGYLFNPKETDSIVDAFERVFALREDEYDRFCAASRQKAENQFSEKTFIDSYIKIIED